MDKKLNKLKDKWYAKLEREGFNDIEQEDGRLKSWSMHFVQARYGNTAEFEAKQDYYRLAGQLLHEHKFESELEKLIWEKHCEGETVRGIVTMLKKLGTRKLGAKIYKRKVHETILRLSNLMVVRCR